MFLRIIVKYTLIICLIVFLFEVFSTIVLYLKLFLENTFFEKKTLKNGKV